MSAGLADGVLAIVKAATDPLFERIKALEASLVAVKSAPPVVGPAGEKGADGKDADPEAVKALQDTVQSLRDELSALQETRAKSAEDTAAMDALVAVSVEKAVAAIPVPVLPDVEGMVAAEVTKAVASLPTPKDGAPGRDGVGLASALLDREGVLVVTFTDGTTKSLGVVVGHDGQKGADGLHGAPGRDGVGFEDVDEAYEDDGRVLVRKFLKDGAVVREFRHVTKQSIYRGVYEAGKQYLEGDEATWAGSLWQAKETTTAKPGEIGDASRAWVLKVKRGGEGKAGKDGKDGTHGKDGRDLRTEIR
jgi:hypothetical protein